MGLFLESFLVEVIFLLLLLVWSFYKYQTKDYNYWKERGITYEEAVFPFGSLRDLALRKTHIGKAYDDVYKKFSKERFFGVIDNGKPALVVRDPELAKQILVKDFQYFVDRTSRNMTSKNPLSRNLAFLTGREWKEMRQKLTPTFTSGKIKKMFLLMEKCSEQLKEFLNKNVDGTKSMDAKDVLSRFTMDIIASCAFGLDTNSLSGNSEFVVKLGNIMKTSMPSLFAQMVMMFVPFSLLRMLPIRTGGQKVWEFLTNIVKDAIEFRKRNSITRNDFLDLLIEIGQIENHGEEKNETITVNLTKGLTVEDMTAQAFLFLLAGFETASSLMTFCLFELSCHQNIQQALYEELKKSVDSNGGKITYQMLLEIPFLDQVVSETLRMYGTAFILTRSCTERYSVPDSNLVLEKGMRVVIPSYSFNYDPQYFPDPFEFTPDRFTQEKSRERHSFVFLPFGEGPRSCIGMRFGLMQAKLGLATIILSFQVHLAPKQEIPIKISNTSVATTPENPVYITFHRRTHTG